MTSELTQEYAKHSSDVFPPSTQTCSEALRKIKETVRSIAKQSFEQREKERDSLISQLEQSSLISDNKRATLLRRIRYTEMARQLAIKFKTVRNTQVKTGMTRIEIPVHPEHDPKTCTDWQLVDIPSEVLHHLQQRNRRYFSQALGTPFTVPPLSTDFGFTGNGQAVQQVLSGKYIFQGDVENQAVQLLLEHLCQTSEMATHRGQPTISEDEFIGKLKVWRESTSTSPSGLHLGHYKALVARHQHSEVDQDDTKALQAEKVKLSMMKRELRKLHLRLVNYALERGYSYN